MSLICLYCPHTDKYYDAQGFIWEPDLSEHFSDLWERQLYRRAENANTSRSLFCAPQISPEKKERHLWTSINQTPSTSWCAPVGGCWSPMAWFRTFFKSAPFFGLITRTRFFMFSPFWGWFILWYMIGVPQYIQGHVVYEPHLFQQNH